MWEREANDCDMDLYRLMGRCRENAKRSVPTDRKKWEAALWKLVDARKHIRQMMSEKDRAETV